MSLLFTSILLKKVSFSQISHFLSRTGHLCSCFLYHNMTFEPLFVVNAWSCRRVHAGKFRHNMVMVASASERLMCYCMWPWSTGFTSLDLPSNLQQTCSVHQELPAMAHQAFLQQHGSAGRTRMHTRNTHPKKGRKSMCTCLCIEREREKDGYILAKWWLIKPI